MGAGRGGLRVDTRSTTFLKKIHVGAFYLFLQKGLFSCGESFFLMEAFWGVCPPPPHTRLTKNCVGTHAPPHGRTKKFSEGGGQSQNPLIKTKKDIKTKNRPHPHGEKIAKIRPPHGDKVANERPPHGEK